MSDINSQNIGNKAVGGFFWKFSEKIGSQFVSFIVQLILARLLLPNDYGIVALLTVFLNICDVFIRTGLTTALIQKKDADQKDFSSVYYANILVSIVLYAILFGCAPLLSIFFHEPLLVNITRVLSLNIIIGAFSAVHNAILSRKLEFKKSFVINLSNVLVHGLVGVILAIKGFGPWALAYSSIAGTFVGFLVLSFVVKWTPSLFFSLKRIKSLFSYSSKVFTSNLLNTLFNNLQSLVIGKFYTNSDLAFYQRGQTIPQTLMTAVDGSLNEVMYPAYSHLQLDYERLRSVLRRTLRLSMYICFPLMTGLCILSKPLTLVLLTEKWLPCVPFMQLQCILCIFWPLSTINHAINAIGKSGVVLKINIISKGLTILFVIICIPYGVYAIMLGSLFSSVISILFVSMKYYRRYLNYGLKNILLDLRSSAIFSIIMGISMYLINTLGLNVLVQITVQIAIGVLVYWICSVLTNNEDYSYIKCLAVNKFYKRRNNIYS